MYTTINIKQVHGGNKMSEQLLKTNPTSVLRVSIKGDFNGFPVNGGSIGPITARGTRWVNAFHKKNGVESGGEIMADGTLNLVCHDDDKAVILAVFNAAMEQYCK
jgi:hypothetical protein